MGTKLLFFLDQQDRESNKLKLACIVYTNVIFLSKVTCFIFLLSEDLSTVSQKRSDFYISESRVSTANTINSAIPLISQPELCREPFYFLPEELFAILICLQSYFRGSNLFVKVIQIPMISTDQLNKIKLFLYFHLIVRQKE